NRKPLSLSLVLGPPHAASPSPPHRRRPAPSPPPDPPEHASKRSKSLYASLLDLYRLPGLLLPLSVRKAPSFGTTFCGEEPNRIQSLPIRSVGRAVVTRGGGGGCDVASNGASAHVVYCHSILGI
uniref:Uncharacterized protein n=1 Tax=Triticum urartu TaxID=4572 RepID=A0A8R7R4E2_TRIUA